MSRRRRERRSSTFTRLVTLSVFLLCAGCVQEMNDQPRVDTMQESRFPDKRVSVQPQVPGTVARGQSWEETPETIGIRDDKPVQRIPVKVDAPLLSTGQEQFGIWCSHCHGPAGYGDGMVVQRGFPDPPSYHIQRLRSAPDGHIFRVITDGHGRMPRFGARVKPKDRWALVAYVRALQLSQHALPADLEASDRNRLQQQTANGN